MTGGEYVLAVDLGTGGPKVALVDTDGEVVAHEFERSGLLLLDDGGVEQDPDDWWRAIGTATRRLLDRTGLAERVVAACMSGQWGGTVAVDAAGNHLYNALTWMDGRGGPYVERLAGGGLEVPGSGYNARKLATWLRYTGGVPTLSGKDPVGQIQWLKHERPDVYAEAAYFLDVPEYLTMRLSGRAVASYDSIAIRWCTDNRDPGNVRYDERLIRMNGLDPERLPELLPSASVVGPIRPEVARELGLGEHVQVVTGAGDTVAAAVGAGAVADYDPHLYVGTSAWLSCHVPFKRTNALQAIAALPSVVPDRYWVATVQDVGGKALSWLIDNVLWPADGLSDAEPPEQVLDRLNDVAAKVPPGSNGVLFFPWLNGERTPAENPDLRGGWFNMSLSTDRATMVRSVLEGIALNARWMHEAVENFVGRRGPSRLDGLRFIGGGANSELWCQIMADVLDRRIRQVADPVLANVRGAGLIALVALGRLTWDDVPAKVTIAAEYHPDPAHRATYDHLYASYRSYYRSTKRLYTRHNQRTKESA